MTVAPQFERAKIQSIYRSRRASKGKRKNQPAKTIKRGGDVLLVFGDSNRHERRIQRAVLSDRDRLFWVTIAIACGEPGKIGGRKPKHADLAKTYGTLKKARNDLEAFHKYYRPMLIGDPHLVGHPPGLGKSAGFFDFTVNLNNPTAAQIAESVNKIRAWVEVNREDPEYQAFQLNFCFSGHGVVDEKKAASIVVADGNLTASQLVALFLECLPQPAYIPNRYRLDLFLDCCHAGAVARSILLSLIEQQADADDTRSILSLGQIHCACLDDENAFELAHLSHSVFTFAFLNECSRRRPPGAARVNLALRDIGWYTGGRQHPFLVDFTEPKGPNVKFPPGYYVRRPPVPDIAPCELPPGTFDAASYVRDPIDELLRIARAQRAPCLSLERDLAQRPKFRGNFSRDELLTNEKFPFL